MSVEQRQFKISTRLTPAGDQPKAISKLVDGWSRGLNRQTLLGVTGSGKTFSVAQVIAKVQKPTLIIAQNKTLTAQLAQEYQEFFPDNEVHYFVSYYDFYQPEAYMAVTDTYIEKEAQINKEIERLRHATTQSLLTRSDVIVVASVSCLYGLGSPTEYERVNLRLDQGVNWSRRDLLRSLISIHFERTGADLNPGQFRALGQMIEIMPVNERLIYRLSLSQDKIEAIDVIDPVSRNIIESNKKTFFLFPARHFITDKGKADRIAENIESELKLRLIELRDQGKNLEAERLQRRTRYDLAMIREVGYCSGIENYSRHFSGKRSGEAPDTLLSYFPHLEDGSPDWLTVIDESHVTLPQISGMYAGDRSRKESLIEHGFRLPSAKDNRPLTFDEFLARVGSIIFTSATPGAYEYDVSQQIVEQVIRPTGLIDPEVTVHPVTEKLTTDGAVINQGQIDHFIQEALQEIEKGGRVLATTLTKKMAEDLTEYLKDKGVKTSYIHSDIKTIERIDILSNFRRGEFDCLVGVNLLREGLDLPEVTFIGVLDADREGFLRSETALVQIIGRAARNVNGRVVLYADRVTDSMKRAMDETLRRRERQIDYNQKHNITPKTIEKTISDITSRLESKRDKRGQELVDLEKTLTGRDRASLVKEKEKQMKLAVETLDFETAALLRDELRFLYRDQKNGG